MNHGSKKLFSYGDAQSAALFSYENTKTQVKHDKTSVRNQTPSKKLGIPGTDRIYYTSKEVESMRSKQNKLYADRGSQIEDQCGIELLQFNDDSGLGL